MNEHELGAEQFEAFFQALWGKPPFAWQKALAARVLGFNPPHPSPLPVGEGAFQPWPDVIALPTASGKTACLDIAVFALAAAALRAPEGQTLTAPRRIFFVVDRRVIVDEAFSRARRLAKKLREADSGVLRTVADALRGLAGGSEPDAKPLACFQLRGGMYRSDAWARSPAQPAIIAATVDQLGSRLLFRAYGRSPKAWPIQAGLAGNDALILLDEAHCALPFLQTLRAVRDYRAWADTPLAAPFQAVVMSATPPLDAADIFKDESEERRAPGHPLGDRQLAAKPATLAAPVKVKAATASEDLAKALAEAAVALMDTAGHPLACVIFVNRVATARAVAGRLKNADKDAVLLTGRMRPFDKDAVVAGLQDKDLSSARSADRRLEKPLFVVATQTLEVGADLDFDLLVTECASLDALRQRFGRLNRMGRAIEGLDETGCPVGARAAVLVRADQAENSEDDPVYGAALANTWRWLNERAGAAGAVDFGIAALESRLPTGEALAALNPPGKSAPVLLPAHLDAFAQTAPEPVPTPGPALFLHGPGPASADVLVCWRADLDLNAQSGGDLEPTGLDKSLDALTLCPPATAECVAVPIWRMKEWLKGNSARDDDGDVEGVGLDFSPSRGEGGGPRKVVRWRGRREAFPDKSRNKADEALFPGRDETSAITCRVGWNGEAEWLAITEQGFEVSLTEWEALRPGDVIVIPAKDWANDGLGDFAGDAPILDFGDRAYAASRGKALLRLHPAVMDHWPDSDAAQAVKALAESAASRLEEDADVFLAELRAALEGLGKDEDAPDWLRVSAASLANETRRTFRTCVGLHPLGGLLLRGTRSLPRRSDDEEADRFSDEDDASSSSGTRRVLLAEHLRGVADFAGGFAAACRLPPELAGAVERAGLLHDLGKADPRFQALLRGGRAAPADALLAKSMELPQGRAEHEAARRMAGYPRGARHELLSVTLAEGAPGLLPEDGDLRDLVLHLVASHHGHCRPFAPVVADRSEARARFGFDELGGVVSPRFDAPLAHGLERLDSGVAERFWRLTRRHGWWGLAWLEAMVRLADHRRSEQEAAGEAKS